MLQEGDAIRVYAEPKHPIKTLLKEAQDLRGKLADDQECPQGSIEAMSAQVSYEEVQKELELARTWDSPQKLKMNSNEVKSWLRTRVNPLVQLEASSKLTQEAMGMLRDIFLAFDSDGSGGIDKEEFKHAVDVLGLRKFTTELNKLWEEAPSGLGLGLGLRFTTA